MSVADASPSAPSGAPNAWLPGALECGLGAGYTEQPATLRGVVAQQVVHRALLEHLPPPPARILDVGDDGGVQAWMLARAGYQITILEPGMAKRRAALEHLAAENPPVRTRIILVPGPRALAGFGDGWDAVLCHELIEVRDDPARLLGDLVALTRPGGVISLVGTNALALALRPGVQGRWSDALRLLDASADTPGGAVEHAHREVGVPQLRAHDPGRVGALLVAAGAGQLAWHGVGVFTEHQPDRAPGPELDTVLDLEWRAAQRHPYRDSAHHFHLLHRRDAP